MPTHALDQNAWRKIGNILLILIIAYLLRDYIYIATNKYLIDHFALNKIEPTVKNDLAAALLIGFYLYYLLRHGFQKRLLFTKTFLILFGLFTLWYILAIRESDAFTLTPSQTIPSIKYLDALYLIGSLLFAKFRYIPLPEKLSSSYGFREDDFKMGETLDILGRQKYSLQLARGILDTQNLEK